MTKEYIERNKAINELRDIYEFENPTASGAFDEYATILVPRVLNNIPAADVVEVVRCKDCLFSFKDNDYKHGYMCYKAIYHPSIGETRHRKLVQDCDFCSHGKRKEGAEE